MLNLSIIIVSWNVRERLAECLQSVFANAGGLDLEVLVVDNASKDNTVEMVSKDFPQVKLIANTENLGFSKANNQAAKLANGRYILLLNPDMRVLSDTLPAMVKFMDDNPRTSVGGCHLVGETGETVAHIRHFPTFWDQAAIILKLPHLWPRLLDKYLMKSFDYNAPQPQSVDSIRGSFFMVRREVWDRLGGLDERYFIWFEEVDFCRQVKQMGGEITYFSGVKCVDYIGQSFKQVDGYKKQKMFTDSLLKYFKKWHPEWQYWFLRCLRWKVLKIMRILSFRAKRTSIASE